tara:strand:- start:363 stop:539 length:177 start_codon:yes stop_codon:yes gene_type:complete
MEIKDILLSLNIIESELNDAVLQLPEGVASDSLTSIDFARDELQKVINEVENLNDFIG